MDSKTLNICTVTLGTDAKIVNENLIELNKLYQDVKLYIVCPKEDVNQRFKWKEKHNRKWLENFSKFNKHASEKNINVIVGISPGLDFNFKSYV